MWLFGIFSCILLLLLLFQCKIYRCNWKYFRYSQSVSQVLCVCVCARAIGSMAENNRYSACIKQHFTLLVRCIQPTEPILAELSFIECLKQKIVTVEKATTDDDKNTRLLMALRSTSTDVVDKFVELLQLYGQNHVANVLLGDVDSNNWPLSQQHLELLTKKTDELCRYLDPGADLLNFLVSRKVLTHDDVDRIQNKQNERDMSSELLRILQRKPDSAFDCFVASLNNTHQSHVTYILTGEGEEPISKKNARLLEMNRCELANRLEPIHSNLVDKLLSQEVITEREYQRILAKKSVFDQNIYLVDIFKRKSNRAFVCFIETLKMTGQDHVAHMILGINGIVTLNGPFSSAENRCLESDIFEDMSNLDLLEPLHTRGIHCTAETGSIKIRFSCMSADSLRKLRQLYESGDIDALLYETHGRKFSERGLQSMTVDIPPNEFNDAELYAVMTPEHCSLLKAAADKFAQSFDVTPQLLSSISLCSRRRQAILSQPTAEERSRLLFDIVSRQADSAFQQLVDALRDNGHTNVAAFLQNNKKRPAGRPASSRPSTDSTMPPKQFTTKYPFDNTDTSSSRMVGLHTNLRNFGKDGKLTLINICMFYTSTSDPVTRYTYQSEKRFSIKPGSGS